MTVSLVQWRAVIGVFNCRILVMSKNCENILYTFLFYIFLFTLLYLFVILQCHGDIKLNPGPKNLKNKLLSVCYWNLNSLAAYNYSKRAELKAYLSLYKYDFICLSETYLDSMTPDNLLEVDGYNLVCADHPDNIKKRWSLCLL